jgi:hypothetical protein
MAGVASARAANRRALHFVYYSAIKKTVSGLTNRVRDAHSALFYARDHGVGYAMQALRKHGASHCARIVDIAKTTMK